jgi:hypothetical protein
MTRCVEIQTRIACGQELGENERQHFQSCAECLALQATQDEIQAVADFSTRIDAPAAQDIAAIHRHLQERLAPRVGLLRIAWAGGALALGVLLVVAILAGRFGGGDEGATTEKLIALMDDIDRITGGASLGTGEEDRWSLLSADAMFETGEGPDTDLDWSWLEPGGLQDSAWDETRVY